MSTMTQRLPPAEALSLDGLIALAREGIASRVLAKATGGSLTLFAFDKGQGLAEHASPVDAIVLVVDGR